MTVVYTIYLSLIYSLSFNILLHFYYCSMYIHFYLINNSYLHYCFYIIFIHHQNYLKEFFCLFIQKILLGIISLICLLIYWHPIFMGRVYIFQYIIVYFFDPCFKNFVINLISFKKNFTINFLFIYFNWHIQNIY